MYLTVLVEKLVNCTIVCVMQWAHAMLYFENYATFFVCMCWCLAVENNVQCYVCYMCPVKFDCKEHLIEHLTQHDTTTNFFSDHNRVTDDKPTSSSHLTRTDTPTSKSHVTVLVEPIECRKCRILFSTSSSAEKHFNEHCPLLKYLTISLKKFSSNCDLLDLVAAVLSWSLWWNV